MSLRRGPFGVKRWASSGAVVSFVWDAVVDATSYVLQVGTTHDGSDTYNSDVGNVLTYSLTLSTGTYYARVQSYVGATPGEWTAHQEVTV
jgi:hypothetical protein